MKSLNLALFTLTLASAPALAGDKMHDHMMMPPMDEKMDNGKMAGDAMDKESAPGVFSKSADGVQIMLHLNPPRPTANTETKVMIMIRDEETHKPAKASGVSVKWVMGKMWHEVAHQPLKADANGNFNTTITFPMDGDYSAVLLANVQGKAVSMPFSFHVMGAMPSKH